MTGLFFLGSIILALAASSAVAVAIAIFGRKRLPKRLWLPLAILFAAPGAVSAILLTAIFVSEPQDRDRARYLEIFGYMPSLTDDRMVSNHSGSGNDRAVFLRAEVLVQETSKILATPGLYPSDLSIDNVIAAGDSRGFSWWIEKEPFMEQQTCDGGKIYEADQFRDWDDFVIIHCPQPANHSFMRLGHTDFLYVIAMRRAE